jgi:membrane-associated protease RseP (regulator of RpoE activity)
LLPIGQFDGGHVMYALFGKRAVFIGKSVAVGTFLLAVFGSISWLVWTLLAIKVVKFEHPALHDETQALDWKRKTICALCAIVFFITFIPVPFDIR